MADPSARCYRRILIAVLALVMVATMVSRLLLGVVIHDQAELVVFSQTWRWTYDEQMPVLAWLVTLALNLSHYFILIPDLVKYAGLATAVIAIFHLTARMTKSHRSALIAALGVFLVPTMNEDMLREYTHTAALIGFSAASFALLLSDPRQDGLPRRPWLLALLWAGGMLAKYTMLLVIAGQVTAFLLLYRPARPVVMRLVTTLALAFAMAAPVYALMLVHAAPVETGLAGLLPSDAHRLSGIIDFAVSLLTEGALVWLFLWVASLRLASAPATADPDLAGRRSEQFLLLSAGTSLGLLALIVLLANANLVRDRWLAPMVIMLLPVIAARFGRNWGGWANRTIMLFLIAWTGAFGLVRAFEPLIDGWTGEYSAENYPLPAIAEHAYHSLADGEAVYSNSEQFAATLKVHHPGVAVYTPETFGLIPLEKTRVLVVRTHTTRPDVTDFDEKVWRCAPEQAFSASLRFTRNATFPYSFQSCERITPAR